MCKLELVVNQASWTKFRQTKLKPNAGGGPKTIAVISQFAVGERVTVAGYCDGTVRYVGVILSGWERVGVELDENIGKVRPCF